MATSNVKVKDINLNLNKHELVTLIDSLGNSLEDMETGNDDLSLRTIDVGRITFYKVDKGLCEHQREWYIRYSRMYQQLTRLNIKILKLEGNLKWMY